MPSHFISDEDETGAGGISKVSRTRESVTVGKRASRAEKVYLAA